MFGRLTRFQEEFIPVTPLPEGSGVTTGTLGPQTTTAWSFASNYRRTFSDRLLNELRIGDTRRAVRRSAAQLGTSASAGLNLPGIPSTAEFPNTLPTFLVAGYQQLGSPPNTATDFSTERDRACRYGDLVERASHDQDGRRPAVGAAERDTAAVADGVLHLQQPVHRSAGRAQHRHAARQLSPRTCPAVLDRPAGGADSQPGELPGVLHPGRLAALGSPDRQRRPAVYAQFSIHRSKRSGRCLQPGDPAARISRPRRSAIRGPATAHVELRSAPWHRRPRHGSNRSEGRLRDRLHRNGGHHHAVHDPGVPVPADGVAANTRQHHARVHPGGGTAGRTDPADAAGGPGTGRVFGGSRSRLRLCPAVEHVRTAGTDVEHRCRGRATSDRKSRASASPTRT